MTLIPDWMPNIHPLIVHFPIALLIVAVFADLLGLILRRYPWLKTAALWLYVLGAVGTIAAYLTGKEAAEMVHFPAPAYAVVSTHADLALNTMLFFSIYALARILSAWKKWDRFNSVAIGLLLVAAGGAGLIQQTAERGGELVFRYGVGTLIQPKGDANIRETDESLFSDMIIGENGSWGWKASPAAVRVFSQKFKWLQGNRDAFDLNFVKTANGISTLKIVSERQNSALIVFGPALTNMQIKAIVNLDRFKGRFLLAHHINNPTTYNFLAVESGKVRLGQIQNGVVRFLTDDRSFPFSGWLNIKVVSSNGHYRGYVNDKLIVHGHGSVLKAGQNGLALAGQGQVLIKEIDVQSLDTDKVPMVHMQNMTNDASNRK